MPDTDTGYGYRIRIPDTDTGYGYRLISANSYESKFVYFHYFFSSLLIRIIFNVLSQIFTSFPKNIPLDAPFQSDLARSKTMH